MVYIAQDIVKELADKHIARYSKLVKSGRSYVRTSECSAYLRLWISISNKNYDWNKLTAVEKMEVEDALYDEV